MTAAFTSKPFALTAIALPLALGLAACGSNGEGEEGALAGEPVAEVPAPQGQEWSEVTERTDFGGYRIGNPDAPIQFVEYASYTCGGCAQFSQTAFEPLREDYIDTGKVSFELRNLVRDPVDLTVAQLVRCSAPEAVIPLSEQWFANFEEVMTRVQQNGQAIEAAATGAEDQRFVAVAETAGLLDFFAARGLSRDQARACLADNEAVTEIADRSQAQAEEFELTGTPSFFLNGQKLDAAGWPQVEAALQRAGAREE